MTQLKRAKRTVRATLANRGSGTVRSGSPRSIRDALTRPGIPAGARGKSEIWRTSELLANNPNWV